MDNNKKDGIGEQCGKCKDCAKLNTCIRPLIANAPDIYLTIDNKMEFVDCSSNILRLLQLNDYSEIIGRNLSELYEIFSDKDYAERSMQRYSRIISGEDRLTEDDEIEWPTEGKRLYRITYKRAVNTNGDFDAIGVIMNDVTDLRAEEAERRVKDMLRSTLLPCFIWDAEGNVVAHNEEASRVFGFPEDLPRERYGEILETIMPEYQPDGQKSESIRQEFIGDALNKGFARIRCMLKKKDGTPLSFGVSCARIAGQSGYQLVVYHYDLSDVTAREAKEKEAEERVKIMLDATPLSCNFWDENLNIIDCNAESPKLFDLPDKQAYLDNFFRLSPERQPNGGLSKVESLKNVKRAFEKGRVVFEWMHRKLNGELVPSEVTLVRVKRGDGYILAGYTRDLREYKKMMAEADEANERTKLMLGSTPLICILRDENNDILDCNQEALNIFGVSEKSDFIRDFHNFYPEFQPDGTRSADKAKSLITNLFEEGAKTLTMEWMFRTAEGEPLPVETTLVKIRRKNADCCLSYSRDLREVKANEQKMIDSIEKNRKLEIQKEAAQAASEAKSQFLASVSHEIRTPMNTILGLLDLLRVDNFDAEQLKYINDVKSMADVLLRIINDILDFHKIESGKLEFLPAHFNLNALYGDLVSRHKFLAEAKRLTFTDSFAPNLPKVAFGDELRISQIVSNFLTNAVKYTQEGYVNFTVDSVTENAQEYIAYTIEDTGIGIKKENFDALFDEFEQFDLHKNRGIAGTGLGLSIAKRLTDMMDGHIRFKSEYGKGTVFTVLLPLVKGDPAEVRNTGETKRVTARPDAKVLVVDDNPGNITVAVGLLARHGITPHTAGDGRQAVEMVRANKYDMVFMDHMMPEMDGVEATAIIRKLGGEYYSNLPVVALSANAVAGARELFLNSGMSDFVSKPISDGELNRALSDWLPPDKISDRESAADQFENLQDDDALNKVLGELGKIQDLSVVDGLARVGGDRKLYIDILRLFCNRANDDISALKKFAKDSQWKDYTIRIHALKTVFANVGNQFMSDWAFTLEDAAARGDTAKCANETIPYCNEMAMFHAKLRRIDLAGNIIISTPDKKKKIIPADKFGGKLEQLRSACNDFQAETAEQLADELSETAVDSNSNSNDFDNSKVGELLVKLNDLVHSFDYDMAVEIIDELAGITAAV